VQFKRINEVVESKIGWSVKTTVPTCHVKRSAATKCGAWGQAFNHLWLSGLQEN